MKLRSIIGLFFFLLFVLKVNGQKEKSVKGVIFDSLTGEILEAVNIFDQQSNTGTFSNIDGSFKIKVEQWPTTLIFSFIGYENKILKLEELPEKDLRIVLKPSAFRLPDIEVLAEPKVEKLTAPTFTVKDFVIEDDKILLVKYGGTSIGNFLELTDLDGLILQSIPVKVKGVIENMHESCFGNIHLLGAKEVVEVDFSSGKIKLVSKYPREKFERILKPCIEASENYIYAKTYRLHGQLLMFDVISKKERKIKKTITVADEENINRIPEELGGMVSAEDSYSAQHSHTGHRAGIRPEHINAWKSLFYKPLFSPLYNIGSEICVFNHIQGYLRFYTFDGELKRKIPINYHQEKKWDSKILKDKKTNKFYTVYDARWGKKFYEINLENGTVEPAFQLTCKFVEKMIVYDGYLFYQDSDVIPGKNNRILHKVKVR